MPGLLLEGKPRALAPAGHLELWPGEFAHFLGTLAASLLSFLLPWIVPFQWSTLQGNFFFFGSAFPIASFCPAVGAGEAAAQGTAPCA